MIDIHSHIIPSIDDGSKSIEMTLEMLEGAQKDGINQIVATPHYIRGYAEENISRVKKWVEYINSIVKKNNMNINIYCGQEIYFTNNILDDYFQNNIGTINGTRYMLIEFPMHKMDDEIFEKIYELQIRDIIPIIAHPERYEYFIEKPFMINEFIKEGYLFQMNSGSISGRYGKNVKKTSELFLRNNIYNFIGSDAHNNFDRNMMIRADLELTYKKNRHIRNIVEESSISLMKNEKVNFYGEKIKFKKVRTFF